MMEVGAMMVGKITNLDPGSCEVKKGEENSLIEAMKARGYKLMDEKIGIYNFKKDGEKTG